MAKIDLKFLDTFQSENFIKCEIYKEGAEDCDLIKLIAFDCDSSKIISTIFLDKSTAIKFAKTLRTEINKIES